MIDIRQNINQKFLKICFWLGIHDKLLVDLFFFYWVYKDLALSKLWQWFLLVMNNFSNEKPFFKIISKVRFAFWRACIAILLSKIYKIFEFDNFVPIYSCFHQGWKRFLKISFSESYNLWWELRHYFYIELLEHKQYRGTMDGWMQRVPSGLKMRGK